MAEIPNPFDAVPHLPSYQERNRHAHKWTKGTPMGTPYHLRITGGEVDAPVTAATVMQMGQYVNPELT